MAEPGAALGLLSFDGAARGNTKERPKMSGSTARTEDARARMSAENRQRVEAYFIDHCARRYEEIFDQVARARRAAPASQLVGQERAR